VLEHLAAHDEIVAAGGTGVSPVVTRERPEVVRARHVQLEPGELRGRAGGVGGGEIDAGELHGGEFLGEVAGDEALADADLEHAGHGARVDEELVQARGEAAESMLLLRQDEKDPLFRVALPTGRPFAWNNLKNSPIGRLARFSSLSYVDRVLVAPVMNGKSCVGVIELADPKSGPFWTEDEHAVRYVADRFGAFLATHSAIVDLAIVARFAFKS